MKFNQLGNTGLNVSQLCLGTMTFGGEGEIWSQMGKLQLDEVCQLVKTAFEAGVNFIDTANVYSLGKSEMLTGAAIKKLGIPRDEIVLATKASGPMSARPNGRGQSRYHLMSEVEASLRRLGVDHIDLYQLHSVDPATPIEEALSTLNDLVRSGKVRYIGVSNWAAWQIMKAQAISDKRNWARFETVQAYYTVAGRDLEREIVPVVEDQKMGILVWSPLAGGILSGKYQADGTGPAGARRTTFDFPPVDRTRAFRCVDVMRSIAETRGASVPQVALAWLLHQRHVTSVIIGAKNLAQIEDNLKSTKLSLLELELKAIDEVSKLPAEYPGWMIERQMLYRRDHFRS